VVRYSETTLSNRARVMKTMINIAARLKELNNMHMLTAIVSGLSNSAILRLKWYVFSLTSFLQIPYHSSFSSLLFLFLF
jgi:hypothetical protein